MLASLVAATVAVVMSRQSTPEHLILISLTIGAAGAAAAAFYRMLAPLAAADADAARASASPSRARAALEREKALVLRSHQGARVRSGDGQGVAARLRRDGGRLRARAMMLIKQVDEGGAGYRELIERELRRGWSTQGGERG